jgi:hypothetical protein
MTRIERCKMRMSERMGCPWWDSVTMRYTLALPEPQPGTSEENTNKRGGTCYPRQAKKTGTGGAQPPVFYTTREADMGLDMYLYGEKYLWTDWEHLEKNAREDGFKLKSRELEIGYWRKHPNLHGFIVETFAGGKDECQEIPLSKEDLQKIIAAVEGEDLPPTSGFFFGESREDQKEPTLEILHDAVRWLETPEPGISRSVYYRASW